jgi:ABC-type multidrug transport system fused ATPase/permease subunit
VTAAAGSSAPTPRMRALARWRALLGLLWGTGRARVAAFGVLTVAVGLLPTGLILATGALLRAVPAVVEHGLGSPGGEDALRALAVLLVGMAALALGSNALVHLARVLDAALALRVHGAVAAVTLGTPGLAPLEDPAFVDELQAVQDAERRGVLRRSVAALYNVVTTRLRGWGAFVVLLGFAWWAPLVLLAAWHLTSRVFLKATENGISFDLSDGATRLRRAEYVRSLAMESPAAKEVRVFGLGPWLVGRYGDAWLDALEMMWRSRRANRALTAVTALALAVSHAAVLGALGLAASRGQLEAPALLVFVQAAIATADLGMIGDWQYFLAQSLGVAERVAGIQARAPSADPDAHPAPPPTVTNATADEADADSARPAGRTAVGAADRENADRPDADRPDADRADADRPDADRADMDRADVDRPDVDRPDVDRPDVDRAAADRAAVDRVRPAGPIAPAARVDGRRGRVAVRLEGVRFTYRGRAQPTLDGLTLDVPAGQSLAIVGENGAGKSTLIKLLCGLYEPDGGRITLDGAASPLQSRGRIGVIFQDFVRYPLPLRENVGFGHLPSLADPAALEGALCDAGGGALPSRLPRGWDTTLSREFDGGADLSGGQWQRVALARALTAVRGGAGLLILDEPTAALDVRAETELFTRFLELTRDVTTILVSHRLSSVRHADRIVVLDGGRVVEDGTHAALMRSGGMYARMYALQADRFARARTADTDADAGEVLDG